MNVEQLRNLPLSENIATKFTAIPMYMWNTSEQVIFCPSRDSKPRAMGVRSWFMLWRSNWNLRQSSPGSRYFWIDFVWFHSAMESLHRNEEKKLTAAVSNLTVPDARQCWIRWRQWEMLQVWIENDEKHVAPATWMPHWSFYFLSSSFRWCVA